MLGVSVANLNMLSLALLVLALAGVLLPPRIVVLGTLPTLLYVMLISSAQYVWNIPFGLPNVEYLSGTSHLHLRRVRGRADQMQQV